MSVYNYDTGGGFSGQSYDRHVFEENLSTVNKLQREYWTAKQVLKKKFGKEQDQHVIASDSELDAKLMLFKSIQTTCAELMKEVDYYQQHICNISRDENQLGRFLKEQGEADKTQAGKMMIAVGKSLCYTAQQRLNLRHPLGRFHQDVETFRYRAISDSLMSVDQMEEARTHYRASLLWMQDISTNLDPEQYKKLEKFRKVQNEVRMNREKFDQQKWAVCQKVDLLSASRCNLFSNTLVPYQEESLKFWDKTARALAAVLESFNGYQHYEFRLLKLDSDGQKKSEDDNDNQEKDQELINLDETLDENGTDNVDNALEALDINNADNKESALISFDFDNESELHDRFEFIQKQDIQVQSALFHKKESSIGDLLGNSAPVEQEATNDDIDLLNDILGNGDEQGTSDFEKQWQSAFGDFESNIVDEVQAPPQEFDSAPTSHTQDLMSVSAMQNNGGYLPSQLMDLNFMSSAPGNQQQMPFSAGMLQTPSQMMQGQPYPQPPTYNALFTSPQFIAGEAQPPMQQSGSAPMSAARKKADESKASWYNLFAELDPLQNPDELGKKSLEENKKQKEAC